MDVIADATKAYRELGVAALFIVMYVTVVWKFIAELQTSRKEQGEMMKSMIGQVVTALESSRKTNEDYNKLASEMKTFVDQSTRHQVEFMAYLKGRDGDGV